MAARAPATRIGAIAAGGLVLSGRPVPAVASLTGPDGTPPLRVGSSNATLDVTAAAGVCAGALDVSDATGPGPSTGVDSPAEAGVAVSCCGVLVMPAEAPPGVFTGEGCAVLLRGAGDGVPVKAEGCAVLLPAGGSDVNVAVAGALVAVDGTVVAVGGGSVAVGAGASPIA